MNVDVVGYVRPPVRGEESPVLEMDGPHRLSAAPGGVTVTLQQMHHAGTSSYDVFQQSVVPLLDVFVAGFNVSLIVTGESGSGKSFSVAGEGVTKTGIIPLFMDNLFTKMRQDERLLYDASRRAEQQVTLQVYEIYNELVRDLMQTPSLTTNYVEISTSPTAGPYLKNGCVAPVRSASEGETLFHQAWARRSDHYTDFGPAQNHSSILIYVDLILQTSDSPLPNKSRFTLVLTPGGEKLGEDSRQLRVREGPTLSKSLVALTQLVAALVNQPYADRVINYSDSKLTSLLVDELGGNCKTRVLLCLKPRTDSLLLEPIIRFTSQCTQIKNFPILNDPFAQQLVTQYRARVQNLQQQLGWNTGLPNPNLAFDTQVELRRLQTENVTLRDQNDRLQERLDHLHDKFGSLASTKTDISSQLLMTEEEKLKISKTLVEMQMENNKLKEECEATRFELTNKVLQLESDLLQMDNDREKHAREAANVQDQFSALQRDRKELADEYVTLKANYARLNDAHDREVAKNSELSVELLNLVNGKAALMKEMEQLELSGKKYGDSNTEVERVRAIVSRMSQHRMDDLMASDEDRQNVAKRLFGSTAQLEQELLALRTQHGDQMQKMERRLADLRNEVHDARNVARERQQKVSEMNARLITQHAEVEQLKSQNNRMQHKLKDATDNFRSRLVKYVEDIAQYMDGRSDAGPSAGQEQMRDYVRGMHGDLRKAHNVREMQLSQAAQHYKNHLKDVVSTHEQLLIAYRNLRLKVQSGTGGGTELGPACDEFRLSEPEFTSAHQKEIDRLREELDHASSQLERLQLGIRIDEKADTKDKSRRMDRGPDRDGSWTELRRQMRQWSEGTQQQLETERAQLLTANTMLEEENGQLKSYIDTHLKSYKDEITRLREMLGVRDTGGGFISPGPRLNWTKDRANYKDEITRLREMLGVRDTGGGFISPGPRLNWTKDRAK